MGAVLKGKHQAIQPVHWLAQAGAVLTRVTPETAARDLDLLCSLELEVLDGPTIMVRACHLAIELEHHLFDTLYYAVALELADAILTTADEPYLRKGRGMGSIVGLEEFDATAK